MERLTREEKIEIIKDAVSPEMMAAYFTGDWGEMIGIYPDGSWSIGQDVGMEIARDERPFAMVQVPGIGNVYRPSFAEGWAERDIDTGFYITEDGRELTDEEMIYEACMTGDVSNEMEELTNKFIEDLDYWE